MNLDDVKRLFRFNDWAQGALFDALTPLPTSDYTRDLKSSHGGIHGTLTHLVGAEKVWLSRWRGASDAKLMAPSEVGSLAELRRIWVQTSSDRNDLVASMTEEKLHSEFTEPSAQPARWGWGPSEQIQMMTTTTGATFVHPYWQMFQHVVNHSSYHRGQITTLMRQLGHTPPQTDLIKFYRVFPNER